jgi:hypothetical protein
LLPFERIGVEFVHHFADFLREILLRKWQPVMLPSPREYEKKMMTLTPRRLLCVRYVVPLIYKRHSPVLALIVKTIAPHVRFALPSIYQVIIPITLYFPCFVSPLLRLGRPSTLKQDSVDRLYPILSQVSLSASIEYETRCDITRAWPRAVMRTNSSA